MLGVSSQHDWLKGSQKQAVRCGPPYTLRARVETPRVEDFDSLMHRLLELIGKGLRQEYANLKELEEIGPLCTVSIKLEKKRIVNLVASVGNCPDQI
jgi:hypothetical protein